MAKKEKALSTQLKEAKEEMEKVAKNLDSTKDALDRVSKERNDLQLELESVHTALDTMYVPRMVKVGYYEKTMTIASRLFAWQAGARVSPSNPIEIE